jgi:hypothetical protein
MRFMEEHWGDLIGLLLLYTGIALALFAAGSLGGAQSITHLGESLVLAGMGVLKLRGKSESNGHHRREEQRQNAASPAAGDHRAA